MAKNVGKFPGLMSDLKPSTPTHTQEYTHTPTHTPPKERKTRRVQLLLRESTVDALDSYAKLHDTSRNEIIQKLVEGFLNEKNPRE